MKWHHKPWPVSGDRRTLTRFLLLPMRIGMETRWLVKATWEEFYMEGLFDRGRWFRHKWCDEKVDP